MSVAGWIEAETKAMNAAWGPAEKRGSLAFVHIPPYEFCSTLFDSNPDLTFCGIVSLLKNFSLILIPRRTQASTVRPLFPYIIQKLTTLAADLLEGDGSVQATTDPASLGKDAVFWDALNKHIKNLHALISGHGAWSIDAT